MAIQARITFSIPASHPAAPEVLQIIRRYEIPMASILDVPTEDHDPTDWIPEIRRRQRNNEQRPPHYQITHMIKWPAFRSMARYIYRFNAKRIYLVETEYYIGIWATNEKRGDQLIASVCPMPVWDQEAWDRKYSRPGRYVKGEQVDGLLVYLNQISKGEMKSDLNLTCVEGVGVSFPTRHRFFLDNSVDIRTHRPEISESVRRALRDTLED